MSASGFNVIRRQSFDATGVRIKELTQALATNRSKLEGSQLETDDVRSLGRMDHSTIKLNDERLSFGTVLSASNTDYRYELPDEPDLKYLRIWYMMDHLGAKIRDISGFQNDAFVSGHPTLRRAFLNIGFQQLQTSPATPVMLFNSGTDVVSQTDGEYIWIPDNTNIRFSNYDNGFSVHFRFNCLNFNTHFTDAGGSFFRRFASKTDDPNNGWSIVVYPTGTIVNGVATHGGVEVEIRDNGIEYSRRTAGYSTGLWYQVVVTYDRNAGDTSEDRIKIYTGGFETSMDSSFGTILATTTNLRIGARSSGSGFFHGYIQDFRMWFDKVLTEQEVINISENDLTISNIEKGHVFVVQYALVQQPITKKIHRWETVGRIIKVKIHRFNVIELVVKPKIHKFHMLHRILPLRTHKYTIVELVIRLLTLVYDQGGRVTTSKTHKYSSKVKITTTKTHRYNMGGLQTQYQRFVKNTTAGSNIVQEITYTSTPQALIVWSSGDTVDNTFSDQYAVYYGFSDGVHHACVSGISLDNVATTDTFSGHKSDKVIALMNTTVGTMTAEATVSFGANKATFNWTTNDNRAVYIHTLALWGMNKIEVKTFTTGRNTTGNQVYSLNDSTLVPTFLHVINRNSAPIGWSTAYGQAISISASKLSPSTKQFAITNLSDDGSGTADTNVVYEDTNCAIVGYDQATELLTMRGTLSSFGTGQFTINWTDAPNSTTDAFSVLTMDSPNVGIGIITQPTSSGTQVVTTDTNVNTVAGLMTFTNGQVTASTSVIEANPMLCIGGASGTGANQGLIAVGENDGADPTQTVRINRTSKVIKSITANATAASSTTTSEAEVTSMAKI